jgi:hypothetical protein
MRKPQRAQYSRFVQAMGSKRLEEAGIASVRTDSDLHATTAAWASTAISGAGAIDINPVVDITTGESHAHERAALLVAGGRLKVAVARQVEVFARHGKVSPRFVVFRLFAPTPRWPALKADGDQVTENPRLEERAIWRPVFSAAAAWHREVAAVASFADSFILAIAGNRA